MAACTRTFIVFFSVTSRGGGAICKYSGLNCNSLSRVTTNSLDSNITHNLVIKIN